MSGKIMRSTLDWINWCIALQSRTFIWSLLNNSCRRFIKQVDLHNSNPKGPRGLQLEACVARTFLSIVSTRILGKFWFGNFLWAANAFTTVYFKLWLYRLSAVMTSSTFWNAPPVTTLPSSKTSYFKFLRQLSPIKYLTKKILGGVFWTNR